MIFVNGQGDNEIRKSGIRCQVSGVRFQGAGVGGGLEEIGREMTVIRNPYLGPCLLFVWYFSWVIMNNNLVKSQKTGRCSNESF